MNFNTYETLALAGFVAWVFPCKTYFHFKKL